MYLEIVCDLKDIFYFLNLNLILTVIFLHFNIVIYKCLLNLFLLRTMSQCLYNESHWTPALFWIPLDFIMWTKSAKHSLKHHLCSTEEKQSYICWLNVNFWVNCPIKTTFGWCIIMQFFSFLIIALCLFDFTMNAVALHIYGNRSNI